VTVETGKQSRLAGLPQPILYCIGVWEILRRMGYPAEDIFFYAPEEGTRIGMTLVQWKGGIAIRVHFCLDSKGLSSDDAIAAWEKAAAIWNAQPKEEEETALLIYLQTVQVMGNRILANLREADVFPYKPPSSVGDA
jgi:hypothetical protein